MAKAETVSTREAAKILGVGLGTFRKRVKLAKIKAEGTIETGKRGRPELVWTKSQVSKLTK